METINTVNTANYDQLVEERVVEMARDGELKALEYMITKYKNFVRSKAKSYFIIGADKEDIIQEGMIGLFKAIRDFKAEREACFRAFAELCITRQMITAIKTATRQKHMPLNAYVSLNKPISEEDSERTLMDVLTSDHPTNPEDIFISQEEYSRLRITMQEELSEFELQVLQYYLDGRTYQEIGKDLDRHVKSIDNALQRVKRKLEKFLEVRTTA